MSGSEPSCPLSSPSTKQLDGREPALASTCAPTSVGDAPTSTGDAPTSTGDTPSAWDRRVWGCTSSARVPGRGLGSEWVCRGWCCPCVQPLAWDKEENPFPSTPQGKLPRVQRSCRCRGFLEALEASPQDFLALLSAIPLWKCHGLVGGLRK